MLWVVAIYWLCVWDYVTSETVDPSTSLVLAIGGIVLLLAVIIKGEDGS